MAGVLDMLQSSRPVTRWSVQERTRFARALHSLLYSATPTHRVPADVFHEHAATPRELERLRAELLRGVRHVLAGTAWLLPGTSRAFLQTYTHYRIGVFFVGADSTLILHAVAHQFVDHRVHLRACKRCGRAFYGFKRAEYCSTACGQAFRDAKKKTAKTPPPRRGGRPR